MKANNSEAIPKWIIDRTAYLDSLKDNRLVRSVLLNETSFQQEIQRFYDINVGLDCNRGGVYYGFSLDKEDQNKTQKRPTELLEILKGFEEDQINLDKLTYQDVRTDHIKGRRKSKIQSALSLPGCLLTSVGLIIASLKNEIFYGSISGIAGLAMIAYSIFSDNNTPVFNEFLKLYRTGRIADGFIENHYRLHVLKKKLGE